MSANLNEISDITVEEMLNLRNNLRFFSLNILC